MSAILATWNWFSCGSILFSVGIVVAAFVKVDCVNTVGGFSTNCDGKTKPVATQQCSTGISCSAEDEHGEVLFYYRVVDI